MVINPLVIFNEYYSLIKNEVTVIIVWFVVNVVFLKNNGRFLFD